ncbi:MAG: hypothetical protein ACT4ON_02120 [Bacteroidota bacterium]
MTKKNSLYFSGITLTLVLFACGDTNPDKEVVAVTSDTVAAVSTPSVSSGKYDLVISDIPFPFEILDNLYLKNAPFNQTIMNPVSNASKYNQYNSKALNLGIYGADLAYAVTYEQFQQIGSYVKTTKKLAEELNIPFAFNQDMMDKYEKFKDNKDSLTRAVCDSYTEVDRALKNNEQVGLAALVVTGSWLEGLYLSAKTFVNAPKTPENADLYKVISEQKQSLNIVIKLLDEYKQDTFFASIINELNIITSEYNSVSKKKVLNEEQLKVITQKVEKLRNRIVEGL